jgi:SpoVK/Ycf46/Vps4 family AAA+-type ATPase
VNRDESEKKPVDLLRLRNFKSASGLEKTAMLLPLILEGKNVVKYVRKRIDDKKATEFCGVKIDKKSWFAPIVAKWAVELSGKSLNALNVQTGENYVYGKGYVYDIYFIMDEGASVTFKLEGHKIVCTLQGASKEEKESAEKTPSSDAAKSSLHLKAENAAGLKVLRSAIEELHKESAKKMSGTGSTRNNFFIFSNGEWKGSRREPRPLSSVVLKGSILEDVKSDLQKFLDSRDAYLSKGIPWRRGYLLYGPPGTGKSSIIKALASDLEMDIYYLSLSDASVDSILIKAISAIDGKGILLLEDIDVYSSVKNRDSKQSVSKNDSSLSALLNSLDGPAAPDGLITFMTTNKKEVLDPALIRKGRVDFEAEIGYPDIDQVQRLWGLFYETPLKLETIPVDMSTAFYYDLFKTNLEDPQKAREGIFKAIVGEDIEVGDIEYEHALQSLQHP